ncbi:IS3 family transposase [Streptomyces sp. 21So2-11]|uniref:IS3 family transposase n=1 Tax=Streptomyces sp. 21So2-11 TaxID=3144408 RepID=UPI003219D0FC
MSASLPDDSPRAPNRCGAIGRSPRNRGIDTAAESFFASLKREILPVSKRWPTKHQARLDVFRRLTFYNDRRRLSHLGRLSPATYEQRSTTLAIAA